MRLELSYGQVEAVLAELNRVATDKRTAFQARLKHLQRLGFPDGANTGKGRAVRYSFGQLMQMVVAVELLQAGMMPIVAARLVSWNWFQLRFSIYTAIAALAGEEVGSERTSGWLWMLSPEALRELSEEGRAPWDHMDAIQIVPVEQAAEALVSAERVGSLGEGWRILILQGTLITEAVFKIMVDQDHATLNEMRDDLRADIEDVAARGAELAAALKNTPPLAREDRGRFEEAMKKIEARADAEAKRVRKHGYD